MEQTRRFVRVRARLPLKLPIRVVCQESSEYEWTEKSRLIDVNQFGAGFTLTRPIEVGRLIQLSIPLPHQLRSFDQFEPLYSVWGLVRHVSAITHEPPAFRVGVAFVGKHAPPSYREDPTRRYEPMPIKAGQSSNWKLTRCRLVKQRRETRLVIPMEVLVETLDEGGNPSMQEYTVTETISSLGTCIPTSLDVGVGRVLRISSVTEHISIFAAIRSRNVAADGITRLGLEFVGDRWPLQRESPFTYQQNNLVTRSA